MPVAILAGGLGTRLKPVTQTIPKALVEVAGEPFIAHQLRLLQRSRVQRVVLCVGYLGEQIRSCIGDGGAFGLDVAYSSDGPGPLGTAGALKKALPLLGDSFFVLYGDSYLPCDYEAIQAAFETCGRLALMTVFRNHGRWDASNVEFSNGQIVAHDKRRPTPAMHHIDYGLGALRAAALRHVPSGTAYDLSLLYQSLLAVGQLAGFEVVQRFYEAGSAQGLQELEQYFAG